jgi:hypothetical protein
MELSGMNIRIAAFAAAFAGAALAGCSSSPAGPPLTCSTVVGTTLGGAKLTAQDVIANLNGINAAPVNAGDTTTLSDGGWGTALDNGQALKGYSGSQLASDGAQFASDEKAYDPDGPADVSYASALLQDIRALQNDCP